MPALITFQYDAKVPSSVQWQLGVQMALPWSIDRSTSSYVGNHGYNRLGAFQGGTHRQPERGRLRRGVSAAEPGSDARPERVPGRVGLHVEPAARRSGASAHINEQETKFYDTYHSMQFT